MARYTLRNKDKIQKAFNKKTLDRIVTSLDKHFEKHSEIEQIDSNEQYKRIAVSDVGHSCGLITFFVLSETFDILNLAFIEFVN